MIVTPRFGPYEGQKVNMSIGALIFYWWFYLPDTPRFILCGVILAAALGYAVYGTG